MTHSPGNICWNLDKSKCLDIYFLFSTLQLITMSGIYIYFDVKTDFPIVIRHNDPILEGPFGGDPNIDWELWMVDHILSSEDNKVRKNSLHGMSRKTAYPCWFNSFQNGYGVKHIGIWIYPNVWKFIFSFFHAPSNRHGGSLHLP